MRHAIRGMIMAMMAVLLVQGQSAATEITFDFEGVITRAPIPTSHLDPTLAGVSVGTEFSGSYTFDDGLEDDVPLLPSIGGYRPLVSFTVTVAGTSFAYTSSGDGDIEIRNDRDGFDNYFVHSQNDGQGVRFLLGSTDLSLFPSDALPLTPPDLSKLTSNQVFINSADHTPSSGIEGTLTSLTLRIDDDGDGWLLDEDCDDTNPAVYPGAPEVCDELDNDCDDTIDEGVNNCCLGHPATIIGTNGIDVILGTPGADVIMGKGGIDTISGLGGDDLICGGSGTDIITGGFGHDTVDGGSGLDTCLGAETKLNCELL